LGVAVLLAGGAFAEPFRPLLHVTGPEARPWELLPELSVCRDAIPVFYVPRNLPQRITKFAKDPEYPSRYVRKLTDAERRTTPYGIEDIVPALAEGYATEYVASGKPFLIDECASRPPFFLRDDGCPLADRDRYRRWKAAHPGFMGFLTLQEFDSDSNYFTRFYDQLPNDGIREELHRDFVRPAERGLVHRLKWLDVCRTRVRDLLFGEQEFTPMTSMNMGFLQAFASRGATRLFYEATSQHIGAWNAASAFVRGAARQWRIPFGWYAAQYYEGYRRDGTFVAGDTAWEPTKDRAPDRGESRSLHRRQHFFGWLSGAAWIQMESWLTLYCRREGERICASDYARDFDEIYALSKRIDRGEPLTPLAILTPLAEPCDARYDNSKLLDAESQTAIFSMLVPIRGDSGAALPDRRKGEQGCLYNSEFGAIFDVLCPDSGQPTADFIRALSRYKLVLLAGDKFDSERFDRQALADFEANGGTVCRYPSPGLDNPEKLRAKLSAWQAANLPIKVEGDIQWGINRNREGYLVYLINNRGVVKFSDEPETFDRSRTAGVSVTSVATGVRFETSVAPGGVVLLAVGDQIRELYRAEH